MSGIMIGPELVLARRSKLDHQQLMADDGAIGDVLASFIHIPHGGISSFRLSGVAERRCLDPVSFRHTRASASCFTVQRFCMWSAFIQKGKHMREEPAEMDLLLVDHIITPLSLNKEQTCYVIS